MFLNICLSSQRVLKHNVSPDLTGRKSSQGFVQLYLEHPAMTKCSCGVAPVSQAHACDFIFFPQKQQASLFCLKSASTTSLAMSPDTSEKYTKLTSKARILHRCLPDPWFPLLVDPQSTRFNSGAFYSN